LLSALLLSLLLSRIVLFTSSRAGVLDTPDFSRKTDITASGTMEGDGETWTTVWEGSVDSGDNAANARFFRVEAQRVRSGEAK
jgi:hypothetical protein